MQYSKVSQKMQPLGNKSMERSSRSLMFFEIGVLKNFANFAGKHLCWSLFLIKLQAYSKQKQSCLHMFFKIGVLKNCVNFTGKHLCRNLFLIKLLTNFVKRHSNSGVFLWNLEKLQEHLFYRTPPVAASVKRDSNTGVCLWNLRNF